MDSGVGQISDTANSAIVLRRDTSQATGLSYPIRSVPDRPSENRNSRDEELPKVHR
jgi:hypothetical protein